MLREIFLGIFNRSLSCKGPEYQRLFLVQLYQVLLETDYSSEASKENINILLLPAFTHRFFPAEAALKTTAHGLPKISRNLSSNGPTFDKKNKKSFLFSNINIKQGKMDTETSKIALNAHVHPRTANQQMSRPERHVDDITDMPRSCRSADSFQLNHVTLMSWHISPRYGHVILGSGYPVLTAINWLFCEWQKYKIWTCQDKPETPLPSFW